MMDIAHRVGVRSAPEAIYRALATRERVAGWWAENTTGESEMGGALRVCFMSDGVKIDKWN